jgi:hypothetical protein
MPYTQADLDELDAVEKRRALGLLPQDVQTGDRRMKYAEGSAAERQALRDRMVRDINAGVAPVGGVRPARAFRGYLNSGY